MKIGIIIPTRGDRTLFLDFAKKQIAKQLRKPNEIIIVDDPPLNNKKDITYRYKLGIERAVAKGCDVMLFWEDDDWYHPDYIRWMIDEWEKKGKPKLFGIDETYYYHIGVDKYLYMKHHTRASAFCTLVTPEILTSFTWPDFTYPFVDLKLWRFFQHKGAVAVPFGKIIRAIGIKHGIGLTGGGGHRKNFKWSNHSGLQWFKDNVDKDAYEFYKKIAI